MEVKKGYKQTEVGVIPEDWEVRPFLSLARIPSGQVDPKHEPFRSMILVAPDHIEPETGRLTTRETAADQNAISGKYLFARHDVIYSKIRPYLRKAVLVDIEGICSADMYPLRAANDVSPGYLLALILGYHFSKYAESVSVRSGMPKINREELASYSAVIPPTLAEQEAIAGALSDADSWIESLEQLIAKKRQIKQGAMQELLTGKRRLPGFRGEWKVKRLGDHCRFLRNGTNSRAELTLEGDVKYLHYGDVHSSSGVYMSPESLPALPALQSIALDRLEEGDLVLADASEDTVGISKSVEIIKVGGLQVVSGLHTIAVRFTKGFFAAGFAGYLQYCPDFTTHLRRLAAGTKVFATNRRHVASAEVRLPTPAEQAAIAAVLSDMDAEITALEAKLAKARQIKQGMMQELLTGRIRLV